MISQLLNRLGPTCRSRTSTSPSPGNRFRPRLEALEARCLLDSGRWTGAIDTDWHKAGNWDSNTVPGLEDTATFGIDGTRDAVVSANAEVKSLVIDTLFVSHTLRLNANVTLKVRGGELNTATIDGPGQLHIYQGTFTWWSGDLGSNAVPAGEVYIHPTGRLDIDGPGGLMVKQLINRHIVNEGTIKWMQGAISVDGGNIYNGGPT